MMKMRQILVAAVMMGCALSAYATKENDLRDTWVRAFPTNHVDDMVGRITWVSVTFSTNRLITWTWEREGKTETHSGRYSLHPETGDGNDLQTNTSVVIIPTTLAVRRPILLKDVEVDQDNRFPVAWTVLKCKDVGNNRMVFLREKNDKEWRTTDGTVRR